MNYELRAKLVFAITCLILIATVVGVVVAARRNDRLVGTVVVKDVIPSHVKGHTDYIVLTDGGGLIPVNDTKVVPASYIVCVDWHGKKNCGEVTYPLFMATRLGEYTELPIK